MWFYSVWNWIDHAYNRSSVLEFVSGNDLCVSRLLLKHYWFCNSIFTVVSADAFSERRCREAGSEDLSVDSAPVCCLYSVWLRQYCLMQLPLGS